MYTGTTTKQPREVRNYALDLSEALMAGDAVVSATAEVLCLKNETDTDLTATVESTSSSAVQLVVSGGTGGENYKVSVLTTTSLGETLEDEIMIRVREY